MDRTYRLNDVVGSEFLRLPLSLLANPRYKQMSLEAKFIYALLLNRMTLSQRNGWINENNEVYLIYTREEASNTLNISYKKAIAAFKELIRHGLLFEQRQGLGAPNLLYVLKAELTDEDAAEFGASFEGEVSAEEPEPLDNSQICQNGTSRHTKTAYQDLPKQHIRNCQKGMSGTAGLEHQELPIRHTSKIDISHTDLSQIDPKKIEYSQSIYPPLPQNGSGGTTVTDRQTDEIYVLQYILGKCDLRLFASNVSQMLQQAIERLFYSESLKIGDARLPKAKIRSYLWLLDTEVLISVMESIKTCEGRIVNPMAYLMSTIINTICEKESGTLVRLPPEFIQPEDIYASAEEYEEGAENDGHLCTGRPASDFRSTGAIRGGS